MFWLNSIKSSVRENIHPKVKRRRRCEAKFFWNLSNIMSNWLPVELSWIVFFWIQFGQFLINFHGWVVLHEGWMMMTTFLCLMTYSFAIVCFKFNSLIMKRRIQPYIEILINWRSRLNMELGHLLQLDRVSMGTNPLYLSNSSKHYHHHSFNEIDLVCAWQI